MTYRGQFRPRDAHAKNQKWWADVPDQGTVEKTIFEARKAAFKAGCKLLRLRDENDRDVYGPFD